jgi:hypothetical protein
MEDYRIGGGLGVGSGEGGGGQPQGQGQGPASQIPTQGLMEEFPALPRTQQGGVGGLEDRGLSGLGQRHVMGSRLLPQLDGMIGQQASMNSADAEKKVCGAEINMGCLRLRPTERI